MKWFLIEYGRLTADGSKDISQFGRDRLELTPRAAFAIQDEQQDGQEAIALRAMQALHYYPEPATDAWLPRPAVGMNRVLPPWPADPVDRLGVPLDTRDAEMGG